MTFLCFLQTPPTTHLKWEQVFPQHPMDMSVAHLQHSTYPHIEKVQVCQVEQTQSCVLLTCMFYGLFAYGTTCALPSLFDFYLTS